MATDKLERDIIYTSKRLLQDLYKQHISGERGARLDSLAAAGFGGGGRLKTPQPDNEYWLLRQVTDAVRDNTGTLLFPGRYVKCTVMTTWAEVPFNQESATVAWLEADADTEEGPVFIALCGSRANLHGTRPDELRGGWFPSSAEGLAEIVRAFGRGNNDPRKFLRADKDELPVLLQTAHGIAQKPTSTFRIDTRELEILFEVFYTKEHIDLKGTYYRRAFFGTPLWAATPESQPLSGPEGRETASDGSSQTAEPSRKRRRWALGRGRGEAST